MYFWTISHAFVVSYYLQVSDRVTRFMSMLYRYKYQGDKLQMLLEFNPTQTKVLPILWTPLVEAPLKVTRLLLLPLRLLLGDYLSVCLSVSHSVSLSLSLSLSSIIIGCIGLLFFKERDGILRICVCAVYYVHRHRSSCFKMRHGSWIKEKIYGPNKGRLWSDIW